MIYLRGTGQGERGPEADRGAYDALANWYRAGVSKAMMCPDDETPPPPAPGFGDSIGAMTIGGGIMGALFHRERTGEAATVDVSLLSVGLWLMGAALALSLRNDTPWAPPPCGAPPGNPLVHTYKTSDGRFVSLCCLQPGAYLAEACERLGIPEMATAPTPQQASRLRGAVGPERHFRQAEPTMGAPAAKLASGRLAHRSVLPDHESPALTIELRAPRFRRSEGPSLPRPSRTAVSA